MDLLQQLVFLRTYSKLQENGKKESLSQTFDRYQAFMEDTYPSEVFEIAKYMNYIRNGVVLPSMRALQFSGEAVKRESLRAFNCSFLNITNIKCFSDVLYLSACGTGVGFSCKKRHINQLPTIELRGQNEFLIEDTKESWADSVAALIHNPETFFYYHKIRPTGAPLSSGGFASGSGPLRECHEKMRKILLNAVGRQLLPIEVHSIVCSIADCIVSGGVRRAALLSLFDKDDVDMLAAKSDAWWEENSHFARANNSAHMDRASTTYEEFAKVYDACINSNSGEPGFDFTNNMDEGFNPCVRGDTTILTKDGYKRIDSLIGRKLEIWNGFEWSTVEPKITGHNQKMLKFKFNDGRELVTTQYHKFHIKIRGRRQPVIIEAKDLKIGDKLIKHEFPVFTEGKKYEGMYLQGFKSAEGMDGHNWLNVYEPKFICLDRLKKEKTFSRITGENSEKRVRLVHKNELPKSFIPFDGDLESKLQWLAGLLDGDGCELKEGGTQLCSVDRNFLLDLQNFLSQLGLQSKIVHATDEGMRLIPDGRGGHAEYLCQKSYRICIGSCQMQELKKLGLKCERLKFNKTPQRDATQFVKVVGIEEAGIDENVYCFNEPLRHLAVFNGVITGQCNEISLRDRELCNLTEIVATKCSTKEDFRQAALAATYFGTLQAGLTNYNYVSEMFAKNGKEEALLGVSITGQAQKQDIMSDGEFLQATVKEMLEFNALVAKRIGINPSARMTTTKPSGSASAVAGCSSGIHAAHSEYYIRRVRIAKIDPVVEHLRTSGYPESLIEEDKLKPTDVVVAIPQAMPGAVTRDDETAIELLERMKHLTLNWIKPGHRSGDNTHNCSITVNYKPEEVEDIKAWLWENRDVYAGVSLLPFSDSTYEQAPFEAITKAQYEAMVGLIPVGIDLLGGTIGGVDERNDVSGCEGSRCSTT